MTENPSIERPIWARLGFMLLFGLVLQIVEVVLAVVAIVQLVAWATRGTTYGELRSLGGRLANYMREIVAFLTFHTDALPYPFLNADHDTHAATNPSRG